MLTLTIEDDQGRKTDVPVNGPAMTIGRAKDNQLRLNERNISRKHARLSLQANGVLIEDLDSYNGVRLNGDRINGRANLFLGDRVQVGDFHLQVSGDVVRARPEEITQKTLIPKKADSEEVTNTEPMVVAALNTTAPQQTMADPQRAQKRDPNSFDESTALIRISDLKQQMAAPAQPLTGPVPKLVCIKGPMAGREWSVIKGEMIIGRGQENQVCIDHRSMSRAHAKLVLAGQTYRIVDMGSSNGTLVNGEQYAQVDLKKGDVIELGHIKLRLVWPGESAPVIESAADSAFDEQTEVGRSRRVAPAESIAPTPPSPNKNLIIAVSVAGGLVLVLAVLLITLQGEKAQPLPPPRQIEAPQPHADPVPQQAVRKPSTPDVLRRANGEMANENWEQAIRILELGLDADNGNVDLQKALDKAENERGAKATFDAANAAAQRGDYLAARDLFGQVAESSVYSERAQKKLNDPKLKNAKVAQAKPPQVAPSKRPDVEKDKPVAKEDPPPPPPKVADGPSEQAKKLYEQGDKALMKNELKKAIEFYLEATHADPKFASPHRSLGIAHARAGNGDAAVEHYRMYLKLKPNAPDAEQVKKIIQVYEAGD